MKLAQWVLGAAAFVAVATAGSIQARRSTSQTSGQELLGQASLAFNQIAQKAMPAVVSISTVRRLKKHGPPPPWGRRGPALPGPGWLQGDPTDPSDEDGDDEELGGAPWPPHSGDPGAMNPRLQGIGSGILIRKNGLILTNHHVIDGAEKVTILFDEKHRATARVIGSDPNTDLAVIQVQHAPGAERTDYPVIAFGNSDEIREGDWAIAIGSPFGLNRSVSFGIVSAKGRVQMGIVDVEDFIQTDAAINPGSSGGPLLNSRGELIGVNTAIFSHGAMGGNMGIGFAVPARIAREVSDELIAHGRVSRGWVGMVAQDVDPGLARYFKVPRATGALVSVVLPEGPAGRAELRSGDVITRYNHNTVEGASQLKALVGRTQAGTTVPLEVLREGEMRMLSLAVQEQPGAPAPPGLPAAAQLAGRLARSRPPSFGLAVEDVPPDIARFLRLPARAGTLVVGVNPGSQAFEAGIGPGDIVLSINRKDVHGAREFGRAAQQAESAGDLSVLFVQRGPTERIYVPITRDGAT